MNPIIAAGFVEVTDTPQAFFTALVVSFAYLFLILIPVVRLRRVRREERKGLVAVLGITLFLPLAVREVAVLIQGQSWRDSLCHQGDVYTASFAAVPHILRVAEAHASRVSSSFLQLPANVEFCRKKKEVEIPDDLKAGYFAALKRIPVIVGLAGGREWDEAFLVCAMSALAASKGFPEVAEAAQELNPEVAIEFMEWFYNR